MWFLRFFQQVESVNKAFRTPHYFRWNLPAAGRISLTWLAVRFGLNFVDALCHPLLHALLWMMKRRRCLRQEQRLHLHFQNPANQNLQRRTGHLRLISPPRSKNYRERIGSTYIRIAFDGKRTWGWTTVPSNSWRGRWSTSIVKRW